jgi:hypothetical protein
LSGVFSGTLGTGFRRAGWYRNEFKAIQAMIQQTQQWRSGNGEMAWLSALVETMEWVSRPELRAAPCARSLLGAVEAHLARPAVPHGLYGSNFSLRN